MMRELLKTLKIATLSGSMLFSQSLVFAQDLSAHKVGEGVITTDKNGVKTHKQTYKFEKYQEPDMLASVVMLGGGFVAGRMIAAYRPLTPDVMIAGVGGAAFIAGEVMSNMKFKGKIDEMVIEIERKSDGTTYQEQIDRLEDLRKSYEEAKKSVSTKKKLQIAAAVAFGAAAAYAAYLMTQEMSYMASCNAALSGAQLQMKSCMAMTGIQPHEVTVCKLCEPRLATYQTKLNGYVTQRQVPALSNVQDNKLKVIEAFLAQPNNYCAGYEGIYTTAASSSILSACAPAVAFLAKNQVQGAMIAAHGAGGNIFSPEEMNKNFLENPIFQKQLKLITFLSKGLNLFFPEAKAGWMPLIGLTGGALAAFTLVTGATAFEVDKFIFAPGKRALIFAGLGAVSYAAATSSDNVITKLDANLRAIDTILKELYNLGAGVGVQQISSQAVETQLIDPAGGIQYNTGGTLNSSSPCLTANTTTDCKPISNNLTQVEGFSDLPDSFKNLASQAATLGDAVSGTNGISSAALKAADNLAGNANAVARLQKKQNEMVKKLTNGKVDLDKDQKKWIDSTAAVLKKALDGKGYSAGGVLASLGSSPISPTSGSIADLPTTKKEDIALVDMAGEVFAPEAKKADGFKLDLSGGNSAENTAVAASSYEGEKYDMGLNEISSESGPSIFDVISSRYIKSGYPRLLEEIKTEK